MPRRKDTDPTSRKARLSAYAASLDRRLSAPVDMVLAADVAQQLGADVDAVARFMQGK